MKLKSWSHFFQAIKRGDKTHDLRKKDRQFFVGQRLTLQEYDPFAGKYTGDEVDVIVTYITDEVTPCAFSSSVLEKGYAILSLRLASTPPEYNRIIDGGLIMPPRPVRPSRENYVTGHPMDHPSDDFIKGTRKSVEEH